MSRWFRGTLVDIGLGSRSLERDACPVGAKHKLADEASDDGVSGGKSNAKIDGSSIGEFAEFNSDDELPFLGGRNVSGEAGRPCGVGGRFAIGGGLREGGTGPARIRLMDCFRAMALAVEPTTALSVPEVTDELRDKGVPELKDVTIDGEGRPPALEPLREPADTLAAFGRIMGEAKRADPGGDKSLAGESLFRNCVIRSLPKRSSSCTKL